MKLLTSLLLIGCCAVSTNTLAQTVSVKGLLVDSLTHAAEPGATVRLYKNSTDTKPIGMAVTDADGHFNLPVNGKGPFRITLNAVGRRPVSRQFGLTDPNNTTIDLGTLLIQDDAQQVSGVEVVAQKPLVKMETDKMTYDVQGDADAKASTVLDMLRKVPMVTVDGQDNITVNGQSSFKVYVDGKPNVMFSSNPSQIFKAMPASAVKSIEVITHPGARYDAEGTGGVLNLIMNRTTGQPNSTNGYNGNVSLEEGTNQTNGSAFISGQQGKLTYSANAMQVLAHVHGVEVVTQRANADGTQLNTNNKADITEHFTMGNLNLGYAIDSMSNVGASVELTRYSAPNDMRQHIGLFEPGTPAGSTSLIQRYAYGQYVNLRECSSSINVSTDYQRFLNPARTSSITLSYLFTNKPGNSRTITTYPTALATPSAPTMKPSSADADTRSSEHTVQADFTTPLSQHQTLNMGLKFIARRNISDAKFFDLSSGTPTYEASNSTNYKNHQHILAGYTEYGLNLDKWSTKTGLRYEHTWEEVKFLLGRGADFNKHYGCLVPSFSFTYNLKPTMNIGLNYGMRISRPGISYLNPYVDRSQTTTISYGNPNLEVEKSHNVSLVFNTFTPKLMINFSIGENFANNQIEQYSFLKDGVLHNTYGNILRTRWTNIGTFINWAATTKTRFMLNAYVDYGDIRSYQLDSRNHGWQFDAFAGIQQTLPWKIKLSSFVGGSTHKYTLQGYNGGFNIMAHTLTKSFFKDKLDLSLRYVVPFTGKLNIKQYSHGKDFDVHTTTHVPVQNAVLSVTWRFGNTSRQFEQHRSKISNDFQEAEKSNSKTSSVGSQGGIGM